MPPPPRPPIRSWGLLAAVSAAWLVTGCARPPPFTPGNECELNTECAAQLVCRLGHCRVECRAQRDCAPGLECVRDELGLGACQLDTETDCMLTSDCPAHLVCHFGRCTNECETNRDCPPGAACTEGEFGTRGCRDESTTQCQHNSECEAMRMIGYICAVDGRCRVPCIDDWDCSDGRECIAGSPPYCDFVAADAGADASTMDAGADAATMPPDGGSDAGMLAADAGTDGGTMSPDATSDGGTPGTPPPLPPRMAAGEFNTCAAPAGEPLHCWGDNDNGQIGDGTIIDRLSPTPVLDVTAVTIVGVGQGHACEASGTTLECWGDNAAGQLGLGPTPPADTTRATPVALLPAGTVEDLSLGASHTCAIVGTALYCWGANGSGQLGLGDTTPRSAPTEVTGLRDVPVEVEAFSVHTCVRLASGGVDCFGENGDGQLGNGATVDALIPTAVSGITDAVDVATGSLHTCALHATGSVSCWGAGFFGQIGDGGTGRRLTPAPTSAIGAPVLEITAGSTHSCARTASAVYCWGDNFLGQCGHTTSTAMLVDPSPVSGLPPARELAAGSNHTCVHIAARDLRCFGRNGRGQLGNDTIVDSWMPVVVLWP